MKKKLRLSLSKIPSIIIAIDTNKEIIFYNNAAKQKFLFIDEGRDLNNIIRSTELNTFIDKAFREKEDFKFEFTPSNFSDMYFIADLIFVEKDYEELFKRKPNPYVAYELADIKIQLNDFLGALKHITFGIANSNDDIYRNYFDTQTQYQVPMKAAFIYLKGLLTFKENKEENKES